MKKNYGLAAWGILLLGLGFYLLIAVGEPSKIIPYLCIGIGCGIFGQGAGEIWGNRVMGRNPSQKRQMEIEREDERNKMLWEQARAGYSMMIYVFAALLLVYTCMGVRYTVVIPLVIAYLGVTFYVWDQRVKLGREQ